MPQTLTSTLPTLSPVMDSTAEYTLSCTLPASSNTPWPNWAMTLHSMQTVSQAEFDAGETYVTLMRRNVEALREGLQ